MDRCESNPQPPGYKSNTLPLHPVSVLLVIKVYFLLQQICPCVKVAVLLGHSSNILIDSLIQLLHDDSIEVRYICIYPHLLSLAQLSCFSTAVLMHDIDIAILCLSVCLSIRLSCFSIVSYFLRLMVARIVLVFQYETYLGNFDGVTPTGAFNTGVVCKFYDFWLAINNFDVIGNLILN